jgi:hypothetical protein
MRLGIFRSRAISANKVTMLIGGVTSSLWYFVSPYLQNVRHYSALQAGPAFLPHAAGPGARLTKH